MQTAASFLAAPLRPIAYLAPGVAIVFAFLILAALTLSRLPANSWIACGVLGNALQAAFVLGPVLAWMFLARRYNVTHWRARIGQWERSFRCSRCGEVFLIPR